MLPNLIRKELLYLIYELILTCLQHNILFRARHIQGKKNTLADNLSPLQVSRFKALASNVEESQSVITPHLLPHNWGKFLSSFIPPPGTKRTVFEQGLPHGQQLKVSLICRLGALAMELECFMRYIRTPSISSVGHPQPSQRMPSSHAIFGTQAFLISASLTLFALFSL